VNVALSDARRAAAGKVKPVSLLGNARCQHVIYLLAAHVAKFGCRPALRHAARGKFIPRAGG
jgi:hypothetical protein